MGMICFFVVEIYVFGTDFFMNYIYFGFRFDLLLVFIDLSRGFCLDC
jgi:hypothetical protein